MAYNLALRKGLRLYTSLWIAFLSVSIQLMKATEQYFSAVLFIMLYKVILTFESK